MLAGSPEEAVVAAWMNSPGHRANIMSPKFHEMGVASGPLELSGRSGIVVVSVFGLPVADCPSVDRLILDDLAAEQSHINQMQNALKEIVRLMSGVDTSTADGLARYNLYLRAYRALTDNMTFRQSLMKEMNAHYNEQVRAANGCV